MLCTRRYARSAEFFARTLKAVLERADVIDWVAESKDGIVLLIMTHDGEWDATCLRRLQAKLNTYFYFVLEGALTEQFPSKGKPVRIQLDYVVPPNKAAQHGMELWMNQL